MKMAVSLRGLVVAVLLAASDAAGQTLYHTADEILNWYVEADKAAHGLLRYERIGEGDDLSSVPLATINQPRSGNRQDSTPHAVATLVFGEHSREIITSEVALWLSRALLGDVDELLSWPELTRALADGGVKGSAFEVLRAWRQYILHHLTVQIIPIENLSGRHLWEQGQLCRRKTAAGVDLNRNWPYAWRNESASSDQYGGPAPFSEPQSRALSELVANHRPKAFINTHSGEWAVYVPWDSKAAYSDRMPDDMQQLLDQTAALCRCQVGPAGAVSQYLAYGTSMDYMHTTLHVPYPITLELYGAGAEGMLSEGRTNKPLTSFKVVPAPKRMQPQRPRRLVADMRRGRGLAGSGAIRSLVQKGSRTGQACFAMYNPVKQTEYRDVVSRWVVTLLVMLHHVADPLHPRRATDLPMAAGRHLLTRGAASTGLQTAEAAGTSGSVAAGVLSSDALSTVQYLIRPREDGGEAGTAESSAGTGAAAAGVAAVAATGGDGAAAAAAGTADSSNRAAATAAEALQSAHADSVVAGLRHDAASGQLKVMSQLPRQYFDEVPIARGVPRPAAPQEVETPPSKDKERPLTFNSVVTKAAHEGSGGAGKAGGVLGVERPMSAEAVAAAAGAAASLNSNSLVNSDDEVAMSLKAAASATAFQAVLTSGKGGQGAAFLRASPTIGTAPSVPGSPPASAAVKATRFTTDTTLSVADVSNGGLRAAGFGESNAIHWAAARGPAKGSSWLRRMRQHVCAKLWVLLGFGMFASLLVTVIGWMAKTDPRGSRRQLVTSPLHQRLY